MNNQRNINMPRMGMGMRLEIKPTLRLECADHCACAECYACRDDEPPCNGYSVKFVIINASAFPAKNTDEDHLFF